MSFVMSPTVSCSAGCLIWFLEMLRSQLVPMGVRSWHSGFCRKAKRGREIATSQQYLRLTSSNWFLLFSVRSKVFVSNKFSQWVKTREQQWCFLKPEHFLMNNLLEFCSPVPTLLLVISNSTGKVLWAIWTCKISLAFTLSCGFS